MKLSLSSRITEEAHSKNRTSLSFEALAHLASQIGYQALCIRPAQVGPHTQDEEIQRMRLTLDRHGLRASMLCLHTEIAANTSDASRSLRCFDRDLDVAEILGAKLIRIGIKTPTEVQWIRRAADQARERGMRLVHQTHTASPFETTDECLAMVTRVNRPNFGLTVEPANLVLCGEDYGSDTLRQLSPYLFNVYVQNLRLDSAGSQRIHTNRGVVRFEHLMIGTEGGINFARFFHGLQTIGYTGYVTSHQPAVMGIETGELASQVFDYLMQFERR